MHAFPTPLSRVRRLARRTEAIRRCRRTVAVTRAVTATRTAVAVIATVALLASACGGMEETSPIQGAANPENRTVEASSLMSTRPGAGIDAAGGVLHGSSECPEDPAPGDSNVRSIAWYGPDFDELASIGLETLDLDDPVLMLESYVAEINRHGGLNGHCFRVDSYIWSLANPAESIGRICAEMPPTQPLTVMALGMDSFAFQCLTAAAGIPAVTILSPRSWAEMSMGMAAGHYFDDRGTREALLAGSLEVAAGADGIDVTDRIGLLYTADSEREVAEGTAERLGLRLTAFAAVPQQEGEVPDFLTVTAAQWQNEGVTAVATTAPWEDVSGFMTEAEALDWLPTWVTSDLQTATLVLDDAPDRQARNLIQASAWRAPGDPISTLDQGCVSLRNTSGAEVFGYRLHTDAWILLNSLCDLLDITFSAVSRAEIPLTNESMAAALANSSLETPHGSLIGFDAGSQFGPNRLRALQADPDCALNPWGCLRPVTSWFELAPITPPAMTATGAEGAAGG